MTRPRSQKRRLPIVVGARLKLDELAALDDLARGQGRTRSSMLRAIIVRHLADLQHREDPE